MKIIIKTITATATATIIIIIITTTTTTTIIIITTITIKAILIINRWYKSYLCLSVLKKNFLYRQQSLNSICMSLGALYRTQERTYDTLKCYVQVVYQHVHVRMFV